MARRVREARSKKTVVIDTNMLLLIVIGHYDPQRIASFKRTSRYSARDYELLANLLANLPTDSLLVTTPHILTEVSNLLGQLTEPALSSCRQVLANLIANMDERSEPARKLARHSSFLTLGITDAAIDQIGDSQTTLVTDDFRLGGILEERGAEVWNLRRLRSAR